MQLAEMKWPEVQALSKDTPIVFPIAALEQHGRHLPLFTDSIIVGEIVRRAAAQIGDRVVFAPVLWLGNSDHHLEFSGTLSAPWRAYLDVLNGLAENFLYHGFKRLVFINGHGGNDVPCRQATYEFRQRHRDRADLLLVMAAYWDLVEPARLAGLGMFQADGHLGGVQGGLSHADEYETSMILRLAPHLVGEFASLEPVQAGNPFEPATRAWIMKDRSVHGHLGCPAAATPEKGEKLFNLYTAGVVDLLKRAVAWNGKDWH